ncbi:unnamed protein product [Mytilus coruscus]|uniref:Uncharacterized protein n=1 Tax=Mytilus coruscus TaxID=42192 RepID=A0A6J8D1M4_MYTCO|nr:unnamed protein product [Mytilus coruscus]
MPPKRKSSYGVAGAIEKMKNATQRRKIHTASPSRPSTPPNTPAVMSPDDMEDLTNRVTERVARRMEKRTEEILNKITFQGNTGNSCVQDPKQKHSRYKAGTTRPFESKTEYPPYLVTETIPLPQGRRKLSPPENEVNYYSNGSTPVKVDKISYWLKGYNIKMYKYLVKGFKYVFDVGFRGSVPHNTVDNLLSPKTKPDIVRRKIQNEISANRYVGIFYSKAFTEMQVSPLGLAEKKLPGTYRMIHHLSFPEESSINDSIPQDKCSV